MDKKIIETTKTLIEGFLLETGRKGIEGLLKWMEKSGFYYMPCSSNKHLAKDGGLAQHSFNVFNILDLLYYNIAEGSDISRDSIIISSLLHDLGKCGDYGKPGYVPNMLAGRPTKANPTPEPYQSLAKPFKVNDELYPVPHEVRSVKIASKFIELTEEEELAILWHNGLYGDFKYQIQGKETPLYLLLHFADMWASRVIEQEKTENGGE